MRRCAARSCRRRHRGSRRTSGRCDRPWRSLCPHGRRFPLARRPQGGRVPCRFLSGDPPTRPLLCAVQPLGPPRPVGDDDPPVAEAARRRGRVRPLRRPLHRLRPVLGRRRAAAANACPTCQMQVVNLVHRDGDGLPLARPLPADRRAARGQALGRRARRRGPAHRHLRRLGRRRVGPRIGPVALPRQRDRRLAAARREGHAQLPLQRPRRLLRARPPARGERARRVPALQRPPVLDPRRARARSRARHPHHRPRARPCATSSCS